MKKIILLITICCFVFAVQAQNKVVRNSSVFNIKGATADTLIKDGSNTYTFYVQNYATKFKVGVEITDSISGYPKLQTILYSSLNFANWIELDTISTSEADEYEVGLLNEPYAQYLKIVTTAIDSTQSSRYKYNVLIEKKE